MMDVMTAKRTFQGPMVSVATPFTASFDLDLDALRRNLRHMIDHGVKAGQGVLLVAAAGGEFPMLSTEERKEVMRVSVETAKGEVPVAASIQTNATREAVDLARYAHQVGVGLGQLSAPYYYTPPVNDIMCHFRIVSEESDLPIMIYNNWWVTVNMNADTVAQLAQLKNVVALKWSATTIEEYRLGLERFSDQLAVIDNQLSVVEAHKLGAVGFITHVSNFWPEYQLSIWNLLEQKAYDKAQTRLTEFKEAWRVWVGDVIRETEGEGPFIKAAMDEVGLCGGLPRPPASPVSRKLRERLRRLLDAAGVPAA